jgi:hypothetical protein
MKLTDAMNRLEAALRPALKTLSIGHGRNAVAHLQADR